ncbi:hypothetical protein QQU_0888, partial [Clostridioides difficile P7]
YILKKLIYIDKKYIFFERIIQKIQIYEKVENECFHKIYKINYI